MKLLAESVLAELSLQLETLHLESTDPLVYAPKAIKIITMLLEKLKAQLSKYRFKNKAEEIEFFREIKPQWVSTLIYYQEVYSIELRKPLGSGKTIRRYYNKELAKINAFVTDNREFYHYYRSGNRSLDNFYFLQKSNPELLHGFNFRLDKDFSTSHDYLVAKILANDRLVRYIEVAITNLSKKNSPSQPHKGQNWTGSKVGLIELIYALHTEGVFNHGTSDLKEVTSYFETAFNINLGQYHRTFIEIRARKSERTKFLNALRENLITRMDKADEY